MSALRGWALRFTGLFDKQRKDRDLAEELESNLQFHIEDNLRRGMTPAEARRDALLKLGGLEQTKEKVRDRRGFPFLESVLQDVRFGLRMLRKSPGFTAVAILTLALGIGANTAIFSVINGLLLHPVGIPDANRLVVILVKYDKLNMKFPVVSAPDFANVRDSRDIFSSAAVSYGTNFNYSSGDVPERLIGSQVSWQWFEVFGVKPLLGRAFLPEEDQPGANFEAVLSFATWKRLFGGDKAIVGKSVELNRRSYKVVGVMGPDFVGPDQTQLWVPLGLPPNKFAADNEFNQNLFAVARLRPEVSLGKAQSFVPLLGQRIVESVPDGADAKSAGWGLFALPLTEVLFGPLRVPMLVVLGAVGFVLLIACTNIAALMLAKASAREREFALRAALGSARWRVTRQMLTESLLLAGAGTFLGLLFAKYGMQLLLRLAPEDLIPSAQIQVDAYVLAFTAAVGLLSGILFGVAPAWHVAGPDRFEALKEGGRSGTAGRERQRLRSLLVISEVALALVLLIGAGLFLKSFARMRQVNPGFDSPGLITAAVSLPAGKYDTPQKQNDFYQAVLSRLASMPGITSAAATFPLPFTNQADAGGFDIEGRTVPPGVPGLHSNVQGTSSAYFSTMRIPLRAGRYFTEEDFWGNKPVVIIDEDLAKQYWPDQDPIGQRLRLNSSSPWTTIVGVVGRVYQSSLVGGAGIMNTGKGVRYYPWLTPYFSAFLVVRTTSNSLGLASAMREAVREADSNEPVYDLKTMDQRVANSLGPQRLMIFFLSFFSGIAILLAALGLYGVLSYSVTQRTPEIGIRVALGAQRREVFGLVISQGLRLVGAGILIGTVGALALARLISSQLFETSAFDPLTLVATAFVLVLAALAACYIPARRATKVDPMIALRCE